MYEERRPQRAPLVSLYLTPLSDVRRSHEKFSITRTRICHNRRQNQTDRQNRGRRLRGS